MEAEKEAKQNELVHQAKLRAFRSKSTLKFDADKIEKNKHDETSSSDEGMSEDEEKQKV